jgi:hypothetical protein
MIKFSRIIMESKYSGASWISPNGIIEYIGDDYYDHASAAKILAKKYNIKFLSRRTESESRQSAMGALFINGWVRQSFCNFECYLFSRNEKDNIFIRAKDCGCNRITVDIMKSGVSLDRISPEELYESKLNESKRFDFLSKKISQAWYEKSIKEADKITDEILQSVSEKLYHELYPIYVKARDYRQRDKLSNIEMRRKLEEGS